MKKRLLSLTLVLLLMCALTVPASAGDKNPTTKTNDYNNWLTFSKEVLSVDWDSYQEYKFDRIYAAGETPPKITYYKPILYVPLGTTISLKKDLVEDYHCYYMTDQLTHSMEGYIYDYEGARQFIDKNKFYQFTVNSTGKNEYGICQGSSITLDRNYCLSTEYNFYVVGVDPKAPVVSYKAAIPELSELVLFSNDVCGSYETSKVTDVVTNKKGELEIKRDVVTVYEFPVGTVMKLTDDAKAEYSLTNITDLTDDDYRVKELAIKEASMREKTYFVNSENDPEGATFYIRGVNLDSNFADVAADAYYKDPVKWAVRYGVTNGTSATQFSPNQTCTTAQILTFLWRAKGSPEPTIDNLFTDVKSTDYYSKAANWACEQGLISSGQLNGNAPCTRGMTVTYLWRLAGSPDVGESSFADAGQYSRAVEWAVKQGITKGTSATAFSPDATCTRGQIMTFLYRAMA